MPCKKKVGDLKKKLTTFNQYALEDGENILYLKFKLTSSVLEQVSWHAMYLNKWADLMYLSKWADL